MVVVNKILKVVIIGRISATSSGFTAFLKFRLQPFYNFKDNSTYVCIFETFKLREAATGGVIQKSSSQKFRKTHRKTPVPKSGIGVFL